MRAHFIGSVGVERVNLFVFYDISARVRKFAFIGDLFKYGLYVGGYLDGGRSDFGVRRAFLRFIRKIYGFDL